MPKEKVRHATRYVRSCALLIPDALIPSHLGIATLKVTAARRTEPAKLYELFATHRAGRRRAYVDLFQVGAKPGDQFEVNGVSLYRLGDFILEYNTSKPKGLKNMELVEKDNQALLKIDETIIRLAKLKLRTYQSQAVLDARFHGGTKHGGIKISVGVGGSAVRLKDKSRVVSAHAGEGVVKLGYERTLHASRQHVRVVVVDSLATQRLRPLPQAQARR